MPTAYFQNYQQEHKEELNKYRRELSNKMYHNDPEYREKVKKRALEYYYRKKAQKQVSIDSD